MKKSLIWVVVAAMLLQMLPSFVSASESTTILSEDFNAIANGAKPQSLDCRESEYGGTVTVTAVPDETNKSLHLHNPSDPESRVFVQTVYSDGLTGDAVTVSFRFMREQLNGSLTFPTIRDTQKNEFPALTLKPDGSIVAKDDTAEITLASYKAGEWYDISLEFNTEESVYSIYIDGEQKGENFKTSKPIVDLSVIRFPIFYVESDVYLDDLVISTTGETPQTPPEETAKPGEQTPAPSSPLITSEADKAIMEEILKDTVSLALGSSFAIVDNEKMQIDPDNLSVKPLEYNDRTLVPVRFVSENFGAQVGWDEATQTVTIQKDDILIQMVVGQTTYAVNGTAYTLDAAPVIFYDRTMIPLRAMAEALNKQVYWNDIGLIVIGDKENPFDTAEKEALLEAVYQDILYARPEAQQIIQDLNAASPNNAHPRILATKSDFEAIKQKIQTDELAAKMFASIQADAQALFDTPAAEYSLKENDLRMGPAITQVGPRLETLGLMYQVTGEQRYAERAWKELEAACSFPDWNTKHYLDTGGMMAAVAIGYDWIYDYLTEEQRAFVRSAMLEKGVEPGLKIYKREVTEPSLMVFWITVNHNWNTHCNAGLIMAALALGQDEPEIAGEVVSLGLRSFEYIANSFAPDGGWVEGPGYWNSTTIDLVRIISTLETALGTDYGYFNIPGIAETAYYPTYITGPVGTFNYSDGDMAKRLSTPQIFYMANRLDMPTLSARRKAVLEETGSYDIWDLIWYDPQKTSAESEALEKDRYFRTIETATMRSSWDDNATFVGLHSGDNKGNHAHLDSGSFILDAMGERWFSDLGSDRITYITGAGSVEKWHAYRTRAEGHNTFILNDAAESEPVLNEDGLTAVVYDVYEDYEEGANPSDWDVREGGSGTVDIAKDGDNHYVRLRCEDSSSDTQAFMQRVYTSNPLTGKISLEFSFLPDSENQTISTPMFRDTDSVEVTLLTFTDQGSITVKDGADNVELGDYNANEWYTFRFDIDFDTDTYDVYQNGEKKESGLSLPKPLKDLSVLRFPIYRKVQTYGLDDIRLFAQVDGSVTARNTEPDQDPYAFSYITKYASKERGAFAITDLTPAYAKWATAANRGVMLTDNRSAVVVRDEITMKKPVDYYWFAHTAADIEVSADKKSAILTLNGKRLWTGIIDGAEAEFSVMDAAPLPTSPNPSGQIVNTGIRKLTIAIPRATEVNISVAFVPLYGDAAVPAQIPQVQTLAEFSIEDGAIPVLDSLSVDGQTLDTFSSEQTYYNIPVLSGSPVPSIEASSSTADVAVSQAQGLPGEAVITVSDKNDAQQSVTYTVHFEEKILKYKEVCGVQINSDMITSSSLQEPENPPENTIDGDLSTRFAASGAGEWIQYDLGAVTTVDKLSIAWMNGDERVYTFKITVSEDGLSWTDVYDGKTSGTTNELETHTFPAHSARYIRITGFGNTVNTWNSITEVE